MLSIKTAVLTALCSASGLSTITGFYLSYPPSFTSLPVLSYFELDNVGGLYADNVEIGAEMIYQIDLWGRSSLTALAQAVDTVMVSLDFARIASVDLYETDTQIFHKAMRYRLDYSDPTF